ncbi:MAG: chemotaxis response regulator protein-glutamate methylesterase [Acidobacteriia bacterium]|nr:chemotaxis response regulator protein-glutamate methylesterase [Terriglobia bacterium]
MPQIEIMIVDDSVVVRKILSNVLSRDPDLHIAGWASNGRLAVAKLHSLRPDIILLDIEMPEMTGLQALPEIRKILPKTPIVMFSTLTEWGAAATLDALSLGATDYVAKPSNQDMAATSESINRELIPKIKALCKFSSAIPAAPHGAAKPAIAIPRPAVRLRATSPRSTRVEIVAIGVSTGGPDALAKLLPAIPARFPVPVLIAQHMPPIFTTLLASRLSTKCAVPVRECQPGTLLEPGCIWIAPGDFHMVVQEEAGRVRLQTNQGPRENFCRPSVDVLFRSVAQVYGASALGIILTGMGQDGLKGCEALCAAGSSVIVQDEATSVVWGMPGFVARAGLAQKILPLDQIGNEIIHRAMAYSLAEIKN